MNNKKKIAQRELHKNIIQQENLELLSKLFDRMGNTVDKLIQIVKKDDRATH